MSYSLSEFNNLLRSVLERELAGDHWVVAEIGELKVHSRGHCYIDLVEKSDNQVKAKMRANIWASTYSRLSPTFQAQTGQALSVGMNILCMVRINFHEVYGLSLNILDIDPNFTIGERAKKRREVVERLEKEGQMDLNAGLPFPLVPANVAVISSEQAAGYGDFTRQLEMNRYGYKVSYTLFPSMMQGDEAPASILSSLQKIQNRGSEFDLVAIIRGGGSQLDLDAFDSYELALGIAGCSLPVLTGIGHERDESVADMVAAVRQKTPTAAAEFIIRSILEFEEELIRTFDRIKELSTRSINESLSAIELLKHRLKSETARCLDRHLGELDQKRIQLKFHSGNLLIKSEHKLQILRSEIMQYDPERIMERGYSISTVNGKALNKLEEVPDGAELVTETTAFRIRSTVKSTDKK